MNLERHQPISVSFPEKHGDAPLYQQMYEHLRLQIANGVLQVGRLLPSERQLAKSFGVSVITCKRALTKLSEEGLIERRPGHGTWISRIPSSSPIQGTVERLIESVFQQEWNREFTVVDFEYLPASEDVAAAMDVAPGLVMQRGVTIGWKGGTKTAYTVTYVPEDIGRCWERADLSHSPRFILLLQRAAVRIATAEQTIGACPAPEEIAIELDIAEGSPMMVLSRHVYDDSGRCVEHSISHFPWNRFTYRMTFNE